MCPVRPTGASALGTLLRHAGGRVDEGFVPPRQRPAIVREARWHCGLYGALLAGSLWAQSPLLLVLWVLPMVLGQPLLRLFLLAEHSGCPQTADMLQNSRTTETHRALRWLCWNMNRHSAHHAYPALPFSRPCRRQTGCWRRGSPCAVRVIAPSTQRSCPLCWMGPPTPAPGHPGPERSTPPFRADSHAWTQTRQRLRPSIIRSRRRLRLRPAPGSSRHRRGSDRRGEWKSRHSGWYR